MPIVLIGRRYLHIVINVTFYIVKCAKLQVSTSKLHLYTFHQCYSTILSTFQMKNLEIVHLVIPTWEVQMVGSMRRAKKKYCGIPLRPKCELYSVLNVIEKHSF